MSSSAGQHQKSNMPQSDFLITRNIIVCKFCRTCLRIHLAKNWWPKISMALNGIFGTFFEVSLHSSQFGLKIPSIPLKIALFLQLLICPFFQSHARLSMFLSGQPKRHLLTTGWSVFVSSKRLVAGDAFIFMRYNTQSMINADVWCICICFLAFGLIVDELDRDYLY